MRINSIFAIPILCIAAHLSTIHASEAITLPGTTYHCAPKITIPPRINKIIQTFIQQKINKEGPKFNQNLLILSGPCNIEKDKIVRYMAEQTKSKIFPISFSNLISSFISQKTRAEAYNIEKIFEKIYEHLRDNNGSIILFINETDLLSSLSATDNFKYGMEIAVSELRQLFDKYERWPGILIVLETSNLNGIPASAGGIGDRFNPDNIIYIPPQHDNQHKNLLPHVEQPYQELSEQHLTFLVKETEGFSTRDLKNLMICINERMKDNNGVLTEAILQESLKIMKDRKTQIANNIDKQEHSQKRKVVVVRPRRPSLIPVPYHSYPTLEECHQKAATEPEGFLIDKRQNL